MLPTYTSRFGEIDVQSKLFCEKREIFLFDSITDETARAIILQIMALDDGGGDINLYINSPGGSVVAGYAVLDIMRTVKTKINTYAIGQAASFAAVILAAGSKRYAYQNSRIMLHQPLISNLGGSAADIEIYTDELIKTRARLYNILSSYTGQSAENIASDCQRDYFMNAEEALDYGLIDCIL